MASLTSFTRLILKHIKLAAYPVGALYWSSSPTDPSEIFGGTWKQIKDIFVLAAGDTYKAGETGGEAEHTLTVTEMPEHWHDSLRYKDPHGEQFGCNQGNMANYPWNIPWSGTGAKDILYTGPSGGGRAHNNMPPYTAKYCFERIK